jgi:phage-related protein
MSEAGVSGLEFARSIEASAAAVSNLKAQIAAINIGEAFAKFDVQTKEHVERIQRSLKSLDIEKEKAIDLAAFEKLTNEKDLYSIHRPNSRKNVRIIYTIIDRKIIILLTVFLEKNKSDYQNAISVAKNRLKQLQE